MKQKSKPSDKSLTKNKLKDIGVSQYSMYRQIVKEIGISSPIQQNLLKFNFKEKYDQHVNLLQNHKSHELNIETIRHKQYMERQQRLKQLKFSLEKKQQRAKEKKQSQIVLKRQKAQSDILKWQKIVLKNKRNQKKGIKTSMKHIKNWDEKCLQSQRKKSELLQNIASKTHEHNEYVELVSIYNRDVNSSYSFQNPQTSFLSNKKTPKSKSPSQRKRVSHIMKTQKTYEKTLQNKKELDERELQKSLRLNIGKQKRINEARELKKYIHGRKNKLLTEKSQMLKNKFKQNSRKLSQIDLIKKKNLQRKLKENRTTSRDVSLPIMSRNAIIKEYKNYENSKNDNSSIYVTVPTEDNTQKYNKIIMDKLRSISVVIKKHNQKSRSMFK